METQLLRHCSRCATKRHISPIPVYHLPRLRALMSIDKIKNNSFKMAKEEGRRYSPETITDVEYADDIVLLANTPAQAESQVYSPERAVFGIGFHVKADKT